jgi:hypothetical protein
MKTTPRMFWKIKGRYTQLHSSKENRRCDLIKTPQDTAS